jgi:hypothetical protein
MTIGLTRRRTTRRIKRLKETVSTISLDYSDCATPDFLVHSLNTKVQNRDSRLAEQDAKLQDRDNWLAELAPRPRRDRDL